MNIGGNHGRYRVGREVGPGSTNRPGAGAGAGGAMVRPSVLLLLWGLFIVYGTTLPFDFSATPEQARARGAALVAAPWPRASVTDVVSNVLLFVPWGALAAASLARRRRGAGLAAALACGGASGLVLSGCVEFLQLFAPTRTPSASDLLTNTAGALLGALGGWWAARRAGPALERGLGRLAARRPLAALALATAAGFALAGLAPYDVSLDVGDLRAAAARARPIPFGPPLRAPTPPADPWGWAGELLSWALLGGLLALALRESGHRGGRAAAGAAALGGGLAAVVELGQLAVRSRAADATSVALAVVGAAVGAGVVLAAPRRGDARRWVGPALVLWGAAVLLANWTPPRLASPDGPAPALRAEMFVPFLAYYRRTDIYALSDILNQVMAFVPLGLLLAARGGRRPVWAAALAGLGAGVALEAGQLALEGRTSDVTDALSASAGAALGAALWRRGQAVREAARGPRPG